MKADIEIMRWSVLTAWVEFKKLIAWSGIVLEYTLVKKGKVSEQPLTILLHGRGSEPAPPSPYYCSVTGETCI